MSVLTFDIITLVLFPNLKPQDFDLEHVINIQNRYNIRNQSIKPTTLPAAQINTTHRIKLFIPFHTRYPISYNIDTILRKQSLIPRSNHAAVVFPTRGKQF